MTSVANTTDRFEATVALTGSIGQFSYGLQVEHIDEGQTVALTDALFYRVTSIGLAYAVNDALSISYNMMEQKRHDPAQDNSYEQETDAINIGYTVGGLTIGLITEYYTSHSYAPVRELANSCKTGAATNMIYGIALGFKSAIIPVVVLALVVYFSFAICDMYGVALAAIGFLSNLATGLTIDVYGPVCDNAGGTSNLPKSKGSHCHE